MNVTAMLAWWDEPPDLLEQAVLSLEGFADRLVAFDGGYRLVAGATPASPDEQADLIRETAGLVGVEVSVHAPPVLWHGQVEKRDALLQAAAWGSDWVFPLDADWVLRGRKEEARAQLETTSAEVMVVEFVTPSDPTRDLAVTSSTDWHRGTVGIQLMPIVFRVMYDMHLTSHHWWYHGRRIPGGAVVTLLGGGGTVSAVEDGFQSDFWIEHHCHFRDLPRIVRNREFCYARDRQVAETGVEA